MQFIIAAQSRCLASQAENSWLASAQRVMHAGSAGSAGSPAIRGPCFTSSLHAATRLQVSSQGGLEQPAAVSASASQKTNLGGASRCIRPAYTARRPVGAARAARGDRCARRVYPLAMLEVMSSPVAEPWPDLLRRAALLALLGASFGTLLDYGHVWTGTVVYTKPWLHGVAWWVPLLYTGASLGIGLSHPLADRLLQRRSPVPLTAPRLLVGFLGLSAVWFASGALPLSTAGVSLILAPVALALWLALDRTRQGLVCALVTALAGCAAEVVLSRAGLFRHTHQDVLGIPIWLPWIYVAASVGLGNIGRRLAAGSSNEDATRT
jgi:hypothetical protein